MSVKHKVRKGDELIVIAGKDSGKKGTVLKVLPKENKVIVAGINKVMRHMKPKPGNPGGMVAKEMPLHISNVAHIDPKTNTATKVGYKVLEDGKKVRFAKKSGEVIDK